MLRGLLLLGATLPLVGLGGATTSHVHNGRIAYAHVGNGDRFQVYTMTATGAHRQPLTAGHRYSSYDPAYSPNGKHIAFVRASTSPDIWTMNADGTHKRALTRTTGGIEVDPAWSPDGKQIAFAVEGPTPEQGIWLMQADGKGSRMPLTHGLDTRPAWSPDGSQIAFQRRDPVTQTDSILVVPSGGGPATTLSTDPGVSDLDPAWSPDGSKLLFASDRPDGSQLDLWVMNMRAATPGASLTRVTNTPNRDERDPAWSPDGRRIVYSGEGSFHGASSSQIYVSNANGSNRHVLTHACGECAWLNDEPSWQPLP
jgi:Tol biopolymer transport system component